MSARGIEGKRPLGLEMMLQQLERHGIRVPSYERFQKAVATMNAAAHGLKVKEEEMQESEQLGLELLKSLQASDQ